ncbi:MAG: hypothetical protein V8R85_07515 [Frisingicoccus sp.]
MILYVDAEDIDGNSIHKEFSVNVVITDEKPPASEPSTEEPSPDVPSTAEPSTEEPDTKEPSTDAPDEDLTGTVNVTGPSGGDGGGSVIRCKFRRRCVRKSYLCAENDCSVM